MKLSMKEHGGYIKAALDEGQSYRDIADELGCSKTTVSVFCGVNFPELRRKPITELPVAEVGHAMPNILVIDIETMPGLAYVWNGIGNEYIPPERLIKPARLLCWAAKWLGSDQTMFRSAHHDGHDKMVKEMHNLLCQADIVIHYNGNRFDIPHLNREFLELGLTPPEPYKNVDLYLCSRRQFRFMNNKLQQVAAELGLGTKVEHEGFHLWEKCMDGDPIAWNRMQKYNMQDVRLTEELYEKVKPWIINHPSIASLLNDEVCTRCGSSDLNRRGFVHLRTRTYPRIQCRNCGSWMRGTKTTDHVEITETSL